MRAAIFSAASAIPILVTIFEFLDPIWQLPRVQYLIPAQYIVSFVVTALVTATTNFLSKRLIRKYGVDNSELASTIQFCNYTMKTALFLFLSTTCLQVGCPAELGAIIRRERALIGENMVR